MATPLIPQEIYLLERYCSLEYYGHMRDAWEEMLNHAEVMLDRFMRNLPPCYRERPLPEQPDIVWGERVLPNFRDTMRLLNDGYIKLSHGDFGALGRAHGVTGDIRGQTMDYSASWMNEVEPGAESKYYELQHKAGNYAWPIARTSSGLWGPGALTTDYEAVVDQPLNPPPTWPLYRLNRNVAVKSGLVADTGEIVAQTGIYLPDVDHGFPTLLIGGGKARRALIDLPDGRSSYASTTWILVERIADESVPRQPHLVASDRLRVEGGQPCPQTGYWFTPAKANSRRHFREGEIMPAFQADYGATIWQWDSNQSA